MVSEVPEHVPMQFSHITREYDVRFFTGIPSPQMFQSIFELMLEPKAKNMCYWSGAKLNSERDERENNYREKMVEIFGPNTFR